MTSATGVALQVRSSACRKGRLENQGLKITLDYPAALKPARAAGDSVLKKNRKTQARSRTFLRSEQYNLPAMASRLSLSSPPLSGYFLSRKLCVCSGGATTLWFPPKSSLPALNALRGPPFSLSLEKHSIGFLGNNETSHEKCKRYVHSVSMKGYFISVSEES